MTRRPPRSTLFPYATLSRSRSAPGNVGARRRPGARLGGGRRGGAGTVAGDGAVDEAAQAGRALDAFIEHEFRSEEHTSELQSQSNLVCRLLLEKKKMTTNDA